MSTLRRSKGEEGGRRGGTAGPGTRELAASRAWVASASSSCSSSSSPTSIAAALFPSTTTRRTWPRAHIPAAASQFSAAAPKQQAPCQAHLATGPYLLHSSPTSPSSCASTSPGPTCGGWKGQRGQHVRSIRGESGVAQRKGSWALQQRATHRSGSARLPPLPPATRHVCEQHDARGLLLPTLATLALPRPLGVAIGRRRRRVDDHSLPCVRFLCERGVGAGRRAGRRAAGEAQRGAGRAAP